MKVLCVALLLMASMALVLIGCSDKSNPNLPSSNTNGGSAKVLAKVDGLGAWVVMYEDVFGVWAIDQTGLLVSIGVSDLTKLCAVEPGYLEEARYTDIYLPNADPNLRRLMEKVRGDGLTVYAWQVVYDPAKTRLREYVCGATPFAVGIANYRSTDNDLLAWMQENPNMNAFGEKWNGTLADPDGQAYKLNLVYRAIYDPDTGRYKEVYKIQLTPTGK